MSKYQYEDCGDWVNLFSPTGRIARIPGRDADEFLHHITDAETDLFEGSGRYTSLQHATDTVVARFLGESCQYCEVVCGSEVCGECNYRNGLRLEQQNEA